MDAIRTARQALKVIPKDLADKPVISMTRAQLTRIARALGETAEDVFQGEGRKVFTQKGTISKAGKAKISENLGELGLGIKATFKQLIIAIEKKGKAAKAAAEASIANAKKVCEQIKLKP